MTQSKVIPLNVAKPSPSLLVTQPYVPALDKYQMYVEKAFNNKWLTNGGPLLNELTERLKDYLGVKHCLVTSSGTMALQLAYRLFNLQQKNVLTTPFTFPATSTALSWQGANVCLADIEKKSWNLCASNAKQTIQQQHIDAIVPVNIFGAPCDLQAFDDLAQQHQLPVIYDSAQAMLSKYKGGSIYDYGDIHCLSFHATKLFHCVEGGAMVFNDKKHYEQAKNLINFGIDENGEVTNAGINGKMSELHAAMGLCILDDLPMLIENRQLSVERYHKALEGSVEFQQCSYEADIPPMYMAIKLPSEKALLAVQQKLEMQGYASRRYFYPDNHKFLVNHTAQPLANADEVCDKILCLPLMHNLDKRHITAISQIVKSVV